MATDTKASKGTAQSGLTHSQTSAELEKYRLLVESVQDYAIFLLDTKGYIITWNKGAQRFKGYKPHEIIGKHFSTFYSKEDVEAKKPERELELAEKLGRVEDEDWRIRKDGSRFWANVIITALFDDDGKLTGFGKVTRDLTERKQQEEELRQANIMLKQQQAELRELNRSKDEFISLASHQLRTPATGVKQMLGMLTQGFAGEVAPEHLEYIQRAYESNERELHIINSLLRVARVDAGKVVLRKELANVCKLLTEIVEEQADSINDHRQSITLNLPGEPIIACIDPEHFFMSVGNILDNASKYTPKDGTITLSASVTKDGFVKVIIKDTGIGIDEKDTGKLFKKFSRISNGLSDNAGGSGLGLYWSQKIIQLHGGRIEVESAAGEGTTFVIYLPKEEQRA